MATGRLTHRTSSAIPTWVSALTVGTWGEISGTNISTAGVRQAQFSGSGVVEGWGGWAKDLSGKRIFLSGGGHSDGADNSVYGINLSANAPAWSRTAGGSAEADWVRYHNVGSQIYANYNEDGKPVAAHLYHWFHYASGKLIRYRYYQDFGDTLPGAMAINPNGEAWTNVCDVATGVWSVESITPSWTNTDLGGSGNPYDYAAGGVHNGVVYELWRNRNYGSADAADQAAAAEPELELEGASQTPVPAVVAHRNRNSPPRSKRGGFVNRWR